MRCSSSVAAISSCCRVVSRVRLQSAWRPALKHNNHGNSKPHSNPGHGAGGEGKDRQLHNPMKTV